MEAGEGSGRVEERRGGVLVAGSAMGVETLRWGGACWLCGISSLVLRFVPGDLPGIVCRSVRGGFEVALFMECREDEGEVLPAPRRSFRDVFAPEEAICHGDPCPGVSACASTIGGFTVFCGVRSAARCCCFLRSFCDSLPVLLREVGEDAARPADIFEILLDDACAMMSFISSFCEPMACSPQGRGMLAIRKPVGVCKSSPSRLSISLSRSGLVEAATLVRSLPC